MEATKRSIFIKSCIIYYDRCRFEAVIYIVLLLFMNCLYDRPIKKCCLLHPFFCATLSASSIYKYEHEK